MVAAENGTKKATEEIKEKIRKILAKTTNPNQHEASVAAEMAARLMDEYGLSMHDVRKDPAQVVDDIYASIIEHMYQHGTSTNDSSRQWKESLAATICQHFGLHYHFKTTPMLNPEWKEEDGWANKYSYTKSGKPRFLPHIVFVGEGMRVDVAVQVFDWLITQLQVEAGRAWKAPGAPGNGGMHVDPMRFRASFFIGANTVIWDRFSELRKELDLNPNSTALVVLNKKAIQRFVKENYRFGRAKRSTRSGVIDSKAYSAGRAAGANADIGQTGLGGGRKQIR
jgi:hypothetical protein